MEGSRDAPSTRLFPFVSLIILDELPPRQVFFGECCVFSVFRIEKNVLFVEGQTQPQQLAALSLLVKKTCMFLDGRGNQSLLTQHERPVVTRI